MTLLYMDSFDHYSTDELPDKGWSRFPATDHNITPGLGRRGGQALTASGLLTGSTTTHAFIDSDTIIVGVALNFSAFYNRTAIDIIDNGGASLLLLETTAAGELRLTSGSTVAITAASIYTPTDYSHYQVKYTKGTGANGFAELKKDGVTLLTITTSSETAQASAVTLIEEPSGSAFSLADDLYIFNGLGTVNNNYGGDLRVDVQNADADGVDTDFSSSTGAASFTHVDDVLTDNDATFNESGIVDARDLHEVTLPTLGTVIHGIQQCIHNRKTDAGTVLVDVISEKPAGTGEKTNAVAVNVSDDFFYALAIRETDPDDDTTWSDAKIGANEWGYKINNIVT